MIYELQNLAAERAKSAARSARWARISWQHNQDAKRALGVMLTKNSRALTSQQKRQCDSYAKEVLGSSTYAPWLYVYTAGRREFHDGWIPKNYYGRWVVPANSGGLSDTSGAKTLTRRILRTSALPDLGYIIAGRVYSLNLLPVALDQFCDLIADDTSSSGVAGEGALLMIKEDGSKQSEGVRRFTVGELRRTELGHMKNSVIQRWIVAHPLLHEPMPESLATIRITTVREPNGEFTCRSAVLKFGRKGFTALGADLTVNYMITSPKGDLAPTCIDGNWQEWSAHPDTRISLAGKQIPQFAHAVELVTKLHATVPQVGLIGWDVTVDQNEQVQILEWNVGHAGIVKPETLAGPCFTGLGWETLHTR